SAVWSDVTGDQRKELIVTGEWMATRVFGWNGKSFTEQAHTGLENLHGWWQTITAADVNGDGKQDLVIGNIGENFYLHPDEKNPVRLWVSDLDKNGTIDQFLTRSVDGKDVPVFLKREITEQFPGLKKGNLKHSDYAEKTIQDLFQKPVLDASYKLLFNYASSIIAINDGKGNFTVQELPTMVQLSSVNAIVPADVNGDGITDLVMGGNLFGFPPQFGRLDASYGHLLEGDGKGHFTWIDQRTSGITIKGEIKDIKEIVGKGFHYLIFTQNDQKPVLVKVNKTK
ncbi:MAG TPA: VCBS repeat-containing protein, partial [Flavisolibacter sp.]|nr:VCBS repeat-containing protein [Flavisolibacter sp.]